MKGDVAVLRQYVKDYPIDTLVKILDAKKKSPLHYAAREGHLTVCEYLVMKGFKVNCRDRTLKTPMHYAALFGHTLVMDFLLKEGGDFTSRDCSGRNALHFAACSWSSESIALILNIKPELVNLGDNVGRTPLHYAV